MLLGILVSCGAFNITSKSPMPLSRELEFSQANLAVFSNAKNHRRDPLVPLVVPTVNVPHLSLILYQRK